jgi:hypothetical protein
MPLPTLNVVVSSPPAQWWQILTACLTPIIALAVAWIALNQYRVAKAKLKLDLFDRRYAVFRKVWETLTPIAMNGASTLEDGLYTPFNNILPDTEFLFGKDMYDYVAELASKWSLLMALEKMEDRPTSRPADIKNLKEWFHEQASSGAKAKFTKYLDFEKWT